MASVQDLLNQAASGAFTSPITQNNNNNAVSDLASPVETKKENLIQKSDQKKQALGGNDYYQIAAGQQNNTGMGSVSEMERDIRQMSPGELVTKYGAEGVSMLLGSAQGNARYSQDVGGQRSTSGMIADAISGGALGLANSIGGIGALGVGLIDREAGSQVSSALQDLNEFGQSTQTPALQNRREAYASRQAVANRDSEAQYKKDVVSDGETVADLKKLGRDTIDAFGNTMADGMIAGDIISSGTGSLLGVGPVAGTLRAAGRAATAVIPNAVKAEAALARAIAADGRLAVPGVTRTGNVLNKAAESAPATLAMGLMESGGSYQQTVNEVMGRTHSDLAENSPQYQNYIAEGMSPEEARIQVATDAGNEAAAITAPAAIAAGSIVGKFAENPLAKTGIKKSLRNIAGETIEEATQGGAGQFAQNLATQRNVDPSQSLTEGIGEQIAQGAIGGLGSAGALQTPTIGLGTADRLTTSAVNLGNKTVGAVTEAIKPYTSGLIQKGKDLYEQNKTKSSVSAESVNAAMDEVQPNVNNIVDSIKETATNSSDEDNAFFDKIAEGINRTASITENDLQNVPKSVSDIIGSSRSKTEALGKLADAVFQRNIPDEDMLSAISKIKEIITDFESIDLDNPAINKLPDDDEIKQFVNEYRTVARSATQIPSVKRALENLDDVIDTAISSGSIGTVSDTNISTPEGQQAVKNTATVASVAPEKVNPEQLNLILKHAEAGTITLEPREEAALKSASALLRAVAQQNEQAATIGLTPSDVVSQQITISDTGKDRAFPSAKNHAISIYDAVANGDLNLAKDRLEYFGNFVKHMNNKVEALNQAYATGDPNARVTPMAYYSGTVNGNRWGKSKVNLGVTPDSKESIEFAQRVANEAATINSIYNNLVEAFPYVSGSAITPVALNPELMVPASEFIAQRNAPASTPAPVQQPVQQTEPVKAPVVEEVVEPVQETTPVVEDTTPTPVQEETKTEPTPEPEDNTSTLQEELDVLKARVEEGESTVSDETRIAEIEEELNVEPENKTIIPAKPDSPIDAVYPNLVGNKDNNWVKQSFRIPQTPITRIVGMEQPMIDIYKALGSSNALTNFLGSELKFKFSQDISNDYRDYIDSLGNTLLDGLNDNLQKFVKDKKITPEKFDSDSPPNQWVNGKALNITTFVDGQFQYQDAMIQSAVLAALQWNLTAPLMQSKLESDDVSDMTGIPEQLVNGNHINMMNNGLFQEQSVIDLANKIIKYWNLVPNNDIPQGQSVGVARAIASEIISIMVDNGEFTLNKLYIKDNADIESTLFNFKVPGTTTRTINKLIPSEKELDAKSKAPNLIDEMILEEPEQVTYIGDVGVPVAQTQMRNPLVQNTPQQKNLIKKNQETKYYMNPHMVNLYQAIGIDNLLDMFDTRIDPNRKYNQNHYASLEGQERATRSAYDYIMGLNSELLNQNSDEPVPVKFAFNVSRVQRLQMIGQHTPQSNKLVREALLPTGSTLDLNTAEHRNAFNMAIGQAFGIKVETQPHEVTANKVNELLNGDLRPAVNIIDAWIDPEGKENRELTPTEISTIRNAFNKARVGLNPLSLHALVEYVRSEITEDRSSFNTDLYFEHDGKTNGIVNAMMVMTRGSFTTQFLNNVSKGGVFFNAPDGTTLNIQKDKADLYKEGSNELNLFSEALRRRSPDASAQFRLMDNILDMFMKGADMSDEGVLELSRDIVKNPFTITLYGSGARGIAGNLTNSLMNSIYKQMSDALARKAENPDMSDAMAFFGDRTVSEKDAQKFWLNFQDSMNALTQNKANTAPNGSVFITKSTPIITPLKFDTYTLSESEKNNMVSNIQHMLVNPMRDAVSAVVSPEVMQVLDLVRKSTQIESIYASGLFKQNMDALKDKFEGRKVHQGYSTNEMKQVLDETIRKVPLISTPTQSYFIAGRQNVNDERGYMATSYADSFGSNLQVYGPANSGVSGIAFLNIGFGDGQGIQNIYALKNAPENTLPIFDGINSPLNAFNTDGRKMNEGVFQAWSGNPIKAILDSFSSMTKGIELSNITDRQKEQIVRAIWGFDVKPEYVTNADIKIAVGQIQEKLQNVSNEIEARHNVMNSVRVTVDQMAGAMTPYVNEGSVSLSGSTPEELAVELNNLYLDELGRLDKTKKVPTPTIDYNLRSVGRKSKSGAQVLSMTALKNLSKTLKLNPNQQVIFNEIINNLTTDSYRVVYGTQEQLQQYIGETNQDAYNEISNKSVNGITVPGDKVVYLKAALLETLVHELIHANTFETILNHYTNPTTGLVADSIGQLEVLMDQFLNMAQDINQPNIVPATQEAYRNAVNAMKGHLNKSDPVSKALALNEFMAWSLANKELSDTLSKTKATSKLKKFVQSVLNVIKKLIWGRKDIPVLPDSDMLSNIQFNSAILINAPASVSDLLGSNVSLQHAVYGNSDHLTTITETLYRKTAKYLDSSQIAPGVYKNSSEVSRAHQLAANVARVAMAQGFNMTMQEKVAFQSMVSTLATEVDIDKNALSEAQRMYNHVIENLTVESFMEGKDINDPNVRYLAQQQYDLITGNINLGTDSVGRTTLLPTFIALGVVNDDFRAILARIPTPVAFKNTAGTLDATLENIATKAVDSLSDRLSGLDKAPDVQKAVDNLVAHMVEIAQDRDKFIDTYTNPVGDVIDRINDYVVKGMEKLSEVGMEAGEKLEAGAKNKATQLAARGLRLASAVITEKNGKVVTEGVMSNLNKMNAWKPFYDLVNDLVGRTSSNAQVYDMIKTVRSMIQQDRQNYRTEVPKIIAGKFTRDLSEQEWSNLHSGLGKTDLAALTSNMSNDEIANLISDPKALKALIKTLESQVQSADPAHYGKVIVKAKELAKYMNTGEVSSNMLRNAEAVANLFGIVKSKKRPSVTPEYISNLDKLISLYAFDSLNQEIKDSLSDLVQNESEGVSFIMSYLVGQKTEEQRKIADSDAARINHYKGYIPTLNQTGASLIIANDNQYADLISKSFVRVGTYQGSNGEPNRTNMGYYYAPVSGNTLFNQGILQNVRHTANGVDTASGMTHGIMTAGVITHAPTVRNIQRRLASGKESGNEKLMPLYDVNGEVYAYERSVNPQERARLKSDNHMGRMIGVWRGRQVEEAKAQYFNQALVDVLHNRYRADMKDNPDSFREYINIFDTDNIDPITRDAVRLIPPETRDYIEKVFGSDTFLVRKDMLNDSIGYRSATVGDAWSGNTAWSKETQDKVRHLAMGIFGNKAYQKLVNSERIVQNFVQDAKYLIVVKSVIVPVVNMMSTTLQLVTRGVPMAHIVRGMPKKAVEINSYVNSRLKQIDLEAQLLAAKGDKDIVRERKLTTEIQTITDAHKRLSIWPLIEAGEFTSISDADINKDDILLTEGKLNQYMEKLTDKLPPVLQTAGRYALITKDTALFQGLQKAIQYGDFLGKAVLYDDLVIRQKKSKEFALGRITEEFVNYDRLPGRTRGYIESLGLLWFYNYKIRIAKIAASIVRNNPVHGLLASAIPTPDSFGSVGLPMSDNLFSKALGGTLPYSVGVGQGISAPFLNPWLNIVH